MYERLMDIPANISLTRSLFYKTLQICNLPEMDKFHGKLVSSCLSKHKSLSKKKLEHTNTQANYRVRTFTDV